MLSAAVVVVRVVLVLFGATVLGLSIALAKHPVVTSVPPETGFSGFAGAFGLVVSLAGLVALFMDKAPGLVISALDALVTLAYLAAGIAMAVALKGVGSCSADDDYSKIQRLINELLNKGGCFSDGNQTKCFDYPNDGFKTRCHQARADSVLSLLAFLLSLGMVALGWVVHRRGGAPSARA